MFLNLPVWANFYGLRDLSTYYQYYYDFRQTSYTGLTQPYPQPQPGYKTIPAQLDLDLQSKHISTWSLNLVPQLGPSTGSLNWVPQLGPSTWSLNFVPLLGPSTWSLNLVPQLGPSTGSLNWVPQPGPSTHTSQLGPSTGP